MITHASEDYFVLHKYVHHYYYYHAQKIVDNNFIYEVIQTNALNTGIKQKASK